MKCLSCHNTEATVDPQYGILPCVNCRSRQSQMNKFGGKYEFTSDSIKEERKAYKEDIRQPFRNGELDKKYVEKWGTKHLNVTAEEVAKAKDVWTSDLEYYHD